MLHFVFFKMKLSVPSLQKASLRRQLAFRPQGQMAYNTMFRVFVAFSIFTKSCLGNVDVKIVLAFLQCLVGSAVSFYGCKLYFSHHCVLYGLSRMSGAKFSYSAHIPLQENQKPKNTVHGLPML